MQKSKWLLAQASAIGRLHIKKAIPCQDSFLCNKVGQSEWLICIVSDGAGSRDFSHIGSRKIVEFSYKHFSELVMANEWIEKVCLPEENFWHNLAKNTFKKVLIDLEAFSEDENYALQSLGSTVILVIASPLGLLVSHIGDGRAGYRTLQGNWESMITPLKGEYANTTVFITSPIWADSEIDALIESRVITEPLDAFVIMSDGCENICYETKVFNEQTRNYENANKPYAGFLNPIIDTLTNLSNQGKTEQEINLLWEDYLKDGTEELTEEEDDKTLILAVKQSFYADTI